MTTLHEIGALLKSYRQKGGLTVSALAERSNVHRNTLSALEHGVGNVELNTLLAVCDQLGLDLVPTPRRIAALFREEQFVSYYPSTKSVFEKQETIRRVHDVDSQKLHHERDSSALQKRIAARLASTKGSEPLDRKATSPEKGSSTVGSDNRDAKLHSPKRGWSMLTETWPIEDLDEPTALQKRISTRLAATVKPKNKERK